MKAELVGCAPRTIPDVAVFPTGVGNARLATLRSSLLRAGAPCARAEAQIVFNTLLRRMPNLRLQTEKLEWRETVTLRGLKALPGGEL